MDFNPQEQKIAALLSRRPLRKVPDTLMKNYVEEVLLKVKSPAPFPYMGIFTLSLALAVGLMIALGVILMKPPVPAPGTIEGANPAVLQNAIEAMETAPVRQFSAPEIYQAPAAQQQTPENTESEEVRFDKLSQEIFILEALGEETGIDSPARMQSDLDMMGLATA